jgi:hypothetical protein
MKINASIEINADESVVVTDRSDLATTVVDVGALLYPGMTDSPYSLYVRGPAEARAAFLRRLSVAADQAAGELDANAGVTL